MILAVLRLILPPIIKEPVVKQSRRRGWQSSPHAPKHGDVVDEMAWPRTGVPGFTQRPTVLFAASQKRGVDSASKLVTRPLAGVPGFTQGPTYCSRSAAGNDRVTTNEPQDGTGNRWYAAPGQRVVVPPQTTVLPQPGLRS